MVDLVLGFWLLLLTCWVCVLAMTPKATEDAPVEAPRVLNQPICGPEDPQVHACETASPHPAQRRWRHR